MLSAEDFERHVCDTLKTLLQPALDAQEATYLALDRQDGLADPDGTSWVQLKAPEATGWAPGGTDVRVVHPTIEAAIPDLTLENFDIAQRDADATFSLVVMCWHMDARFPVLNRMSKRYSAAVHSCLTVPGALGDCSIESVRFAWRTNPEERDQDQRIEAGGLIVYRLNSGQIRA